MAIFPINGDKRKKCNRLTVFLLVLNAGLCLWIFFHAEADTHFSISHVSTKRIYNLLPTEYEDDLRVRFKRMVQTATSAGDPGLVRLVQNMIDKPSNGHPMRVHELRMIKTPQAKYVDTILRFKTRGFFVECGAFDGETSSNTVFLEQSRGWTGLLVEMDPFFYTQLMGKNRRVSSINAGLSLQKYPTEMPFLESNGQKGKLLPTNTSGVATSRNVPCFPFETLMLALNRKHVDYFSLDVEGYELDVLQTIPFDRINIDVLSVEHLHVSQGKEAIREFMMAQGYVMYKDIHYISFKELVFVDDYIFVKKNLVNVTIQ